MGNFTKSYEITLKHEGGYSFDPDDAGGETYKGISRRFNPQWSGWKIIDYSDKENLDNIEDLQTQVFSYYRIMYWDKFQGDLIPDQDIANELFDTSVNMGVHRAVSFLQKTLNSLNRNQRNYSDIIEDGVFGKNTLKTLKKYLSIDKPLILLKIMNVLQGMHYISYMNKSPVQEKYARGWFGRVSL